jgi:hypothetical protein
MLQQDIMSLKNTCPDDFCKLVIGEANALNAWSKSITVGEMSKGAIDEYGPRQSSQISITTTPQWKVFDDVIYGIFSKGLTKFGDLLGYPTPVSKDEGYMLLRYTEGQEYTVHTDTIRDRPRLVSGLLYLNDDYTGGELHFPRQNLTIKPEAGTLVMFHANASYPHASLPITSGVKYVVVTWFIH